MKPSFALAAAALALGLAHTASAQEAATQPATAPHPKAPLGRWITESGNLEVEIAPAPLTPMALPVRTPVAAAAPTPSAARWCACWPTGR